MREVLRATFGLAGIVGVTVLFASVDTARADGAEKRKISEGTNLRVFSIPKEISLSSEQKAQLDEIKKEQGPKFAELSTKLKSVLTEEQKAARKEALAKAKADGVSRKMRSAAVQDALKLTDEQKKLKSELQPELTSLRRSIKRKIYDLLTDEQKAYYKLPKTKTIS